MARRVSHLTATKAGQLRALKPGETRLPKLEDFLQKSGIKVQVTKAKVAGGIVIRVRGAVTHRGFETLQNIKDDLKTMAGLDDANVVILVTRKGKQPSAKTQDSGPVILKFQKP